MSLNEYNSLKLSQRDNPNRINDANYFSVHDRNDVVCTAIFGGLIGTKKRVQELLANT
jgi:hypothetical protein